MATDPQQWPDPQLDPRPEPARVFISYSRRHRALVRDLTRMMRVAAPGIFRDEDDIRLGDRFKDRIEQALLTATTVMVFWCGHASRSKWVSWEVLFALARRKTIVPVLLDSTPLSKPLAELEYLDLRDHVSHARFQPFGWALLLLALLPVIFWPGVFFWKDVVPQHPVDVAKPGDSAISSFTTPEAPRCDAYRPLPEPLVCKDPQEYEQHEFFVFPDVSGRKARYSPAVLRVFAVGATCLALAALWMLLREGWPSARAKLAGTDRERLRAAALQLAEYFERESVTSRGRMS